MTVGKPLGLLRLGAGCCENQSCDLEDLNSACLLQTPERREGLEIEFTGLPWWLSGKESSCSAGDMGFIPGLGRSPGGGQDNPLQYSCLENPHRQRSLAGYSIWGHKELDTTE